MADLKISAMPAASSVADTDVTPIVQGVTNKKSAMSVIKAYMLAAFNSVYVPLTRTLTIGGSAQTLAANRTWTSTTILDGAFGTPAQGDVLVRGPSTWQFLPAGTAGNFLTTHGASANPTWSAGASFTAGNLTNAGTDGITVTGGTNAVNGSGTSLSQHVADATHNGYLSSSDWVGFNGASAGAALTKTDDTNVTLTLGGSPTTAAVHAVSLTLGWTGTLAAGRGGTGVSSLGNITKTDDTNVTLTLGGTPTGAVINATSFTLGWTGTLSVARGGSGAGTLTGVLIGNGTSAFTTKTNPSGGFLGDTDTQTVTNKRITKRVLSTSAPGATPTINTDNYDRVHFTALGTAITNMTTNLTGTPVEGDTLWVDFTDDGTARAITWSTGFEASTVALPTTTVVSTRLDVGFTRNTVTSKWRCVAVA